MPTCDSYSNLLSPSFSQARASNPVGVARASGGPGDSIPVQITPFENPHSFEYDGPIRDLPVYIEQIEAMARRLAVNPNYSNRYPGPPMTRRSFETAVHQQLSQFLLEPVHEGTLPEIQARIRSALPSDAQVRVELVGDVLDVHVTLMEQPWTEATTNDLTTALRESVPAGIAWDNPKPGHIRIGKELPPPSRAHIKTRYERPWVI